ncbi:MAG: hypothetical protein IJS74_00835 [Clostridia bacterium]|nr:hypothetical protein [Clostridia bacterium]
MRKKNKVINLFIRLFVVLAVISAVVFSVYFALDKWVVPKYFKAYGINNMQELVTTMKTLYTSPKEDKMITNGFNKADENLATEKLIAAGFPTTHDNSIDYQAIADGGNYTLHAGEYKFTDKELAAIINQMLHSGILENKLPYLQYIDTTSISVLEVDIYPQKIEGDGETTYSQKSADVKFIFKFDTSAVRNKIAEEMDTPMFLLNMILPKVIYITTEFNITIEDDGTYTMTNGTVGINNRTAQQSQILLDMLIGFIFPEQDEMTTAKLIAEFEKIIPQGLGYLGNISFENQINAQGLKGFILTVN